MGRSLPNILFSAFGSVITATGGEEGDASRPVRSGTPEDVGVLLAYARKVVIIPGYGLAVAQAQHTVRELAEALKAKGVEGFFAIHPVAGRMPGHMNVLLAEANVPYEDLKEMDEANPEMSTADVALVVGRQRHRQPGGQVDAGQPHLRHADHPRRRGREHHLPQALHATRLRRHRQRAALRPQDDNALRGRQGHPAEAGGGGQRRLSWAGAACGRGGVATAGSRPARTAAAQPRLSPNREFSAPGRSPRDGAS